MIGEKRELFFQQRQKKCPSLNKISPFSILQKKNEGINTRSIDPFANSRKFKTGFEK